MRSPARPASTRSARDASLNKGSCLPSQKSLASASGGIFGFSLQRLSMHSLQRHTVSVSSPTPALRGSESEAHPASLYTSRAVCAGAGACWSRPGAHAGGMLLVFGYERPSLLVAVDVEEFMHLVFWAKTELAVICDQEGTWSRVSAFICFWLLSAVFVVALIVCVSTSIELLLP